MCQGQALNVGVDVNAMVEKKRRDVIPLYIKTIKPWLCILCGCGVRLRIDIINTNVRTSSFCNC